jgi:hypothetical protein
MWPKETGMSDLARIEIERDVADAAARRAAEEGLTVTAYISLLLRRSFERLPGEESVLVYDGVYADGEFRIDREAMRMTRATNAAPLCMAVSSAAAVDASSRR